MTTTLHDLYIQVILAIAIAWIVCFILTVTDTLPDDETKWGYEARTDIKLDVLTDSKWFRFPYPGKLTLTEELVTECISFHKDCVVFHFCHGVGLELLATPFKWFMSFIRALCFLT